MHKDMKIGLDYDGVIADAAEMKRLWIEENLGRSLSKWKTHRDECIGIIGESDYKIMATILYGKDWTLKTPEVKDAADCLRKLKQQGNLLYIVTGRPTRETDFAQKWLAQKNILELFLGIHNIHQGIGDTKAQVCRELELDVLVDDYLVHLKQGFPKKRILLRDGSPETIKMPDGVEYARNWQEVMEKLRQ